MSAERELSDSVVVVTGAAAGIGAVLARSFADLGADVVAIDLPALEGQGQSLAEKVNNSAKGHIRFFAGDVTDSVSMTAAVAMAERDFGGVDILVNNAAIYRTLSGRSAWADVDPDEFDRVMKVNVRGVWQATAAVTRAMVVRGGGSIINFASTTARLGITGFPHYVASKGAVEALTRAAAREFGVDRIRVNAVSPGLISDEATRFHNDESYIARAVSARSIPGELIPEDLVGAVQWLASSASSFVTGQVLVVDGGQVFA
ncbi:NAD(P)-dependent dehydrogenase, short-chain alcohol dehydrogenase family [Cryobacterium flavum]|uniref:NAD(P)-dependent dehydrogenase, short-chain alcohol dehydrogenase family n=1 Tax=Cryobacterium flavum TaxID=1424659 RepID=A0A4R8V8C7_9MICO|nr:SDR family oxidoreductase [Cryobacterium flavum]TFB77978.1 SDR family oxidoreductase [Cryobacterium flavum]SDO24156.1 NAD(P)-dependent dehydrogenase, short-chain alcohol dehydrogenase family [Cryobacterium flavum]